MLRQFLVLFVVCSWCNTVLPQASAQSAPEVEVSVASGGIRRYEPGAWSMLTVTGVNHGDTDVESLASVYLDDEKRLQYARRFWIPAKSRRRTTLPFRVSDSVSRQDDQLEVATLVIQNAAGREILARRQMDSLVDVTPLIMDTEMVKTGTIFPLDSYASGTAEIDYRFYEHVIVRGRRLVDLSRTVIEFPSISGLNPTMPSVLEGFDQIIIADDRVMEDTGVLVAIRKWLHQGGRVWLALDRIDASVAEALLGNAICYEEVDRVELSSYTLEDLTQADEGIRFQDFQFEEPIEFRRVLTDSADVHCRIDGWPAVFWQRVGDGEVLMTTLESTGFSECLKNNPPSCLRSIAERFYVMRENRPVTPQAIEPVLQEMIGYRIPSRRTVAAILGVNCVCLIAVGVWFARRRRLDRMAIIAPLLMLVSASVLIAIGSGNTRSVPSTAASVQVVRVVPETSEANVSGVALYYHQESEALDLASRQGGVIDPGPGVELAETRRFLWADDEDGRWENLTLNSGATMPVHYRASVALPGSVHARGHFGPEGLAGRLQADGLGAVEDPVIVAPPGNPIRVSLNANGAFVSGVDDVLPRGEYLVGTLLDDEQRRRHGILRNLLDPRDAYPFPRHPSLLVWSPPVHIGLEVEAAGYENNHSALATIPLTIERTRPETSFVVPSPFVRVELATGASGTSSIFNPRKGEWLESWATTATELRFFVPHQVRPCNVEKATLTAKLNIPSRTLEVSGRAGSQNIELARWRNPREVLHLDIDQAEVLQLDEEGALTLRFAVGQSESEAEGKNAMKSRNSTWKIDYVRLDVYGTTAEN
jgi:hypothetical protein